MAYEPHERLLADHQEARDHIGTYKTAVTCHVRQSQITDEKDAN
jgi:hypothetical protein